MPDTRSDLENGLLALRGAALGGFSAKLTGPQAKAVKAHVDGLTEQLPRVEFKAFQDGFFAKGEHGDRVTFYRALEARQRAKVETPAAPAAANAVELCVDALPQIVPSERAEASDAHA